MNTKSNPRDKICMICFVEPKTRTQICKELYGKKNQRVYTSYIPDLYKKGWIKPLFKTDLKNPYFQTQPKCFLESFEKQLKDNNVTLTNIEKRKLKSFINGDYFKYIIELLTKPTVLNQIDDFSTLMTLLSYRFSIITIKNIFAYYKFKKPRIDITLESTLLDFTVDKEGNVIKKEILPQTKLVFDITEKLFSKNDVSEENIMPSSLSSELECLGISLIDKLRFLQPRIHANFLYGMFVSMARFVEYSNNMDQLN
jgi:hypothetical protein